MGVGDVVASIGIAIEICFIALCLVISGRRIYLSANQHPSYRPGVNKQPGPERRFLGLPASRWFTPRDGAERRLFTWLRIAGVAFIIALAMRMLAFDLT